MSIIYSYPVSTSNFNISYEYILPSVELIKEGLERYALTPAPIDVDLSALKFDKMNSEFVCTPPLPFFVFQILFLFLSLFILYTFSYCLLVDQTTP